MYVILFLAGGVVGAVATKRVLEHEFRERLHHPEEIPAMVAKQLRDQMDLTDEQTRKVEGALRERQSAFRSLRRKYQPEFEEELDRVEEQVSSLLNATQKDQWHSIMAKYRKDWVPSIPD